VAGVAQAGLFRWDDRALKWIEYTSVTDHPTRAGWLPGFGGLCLHTVLTDSRRPGRVTVGISSVGTLRSDDDGATWQIKNQGVSAAVEAEEPKYSELNRCVHRLVLDPTDPDHLYQQNHTGVYRSFDAGDSWERIETGLPSRFGFGMVALDRSPSTLFVMPLISDEVRIPVGGQLCAYRSGNYGDSWEACGTGLPVSNYSAVLRDALTTGIGDSSSVYFGTTSTPPGTRETVGVACQGSSRASSACARSPLSDAHRYGVDPRFIAGFHQGRGGVCGHRGECRCRPRRGYHASPIAAHSPRG
jgi:hypothetical protein